MSYTLVVIDCQRQFVAARKKSIVQNCKSLIALAMQDSANIIFLEYVGFGKTNNTLTKLIDSYTGAHFIRKTECSGSDNIFDVRNAFCLQTQHFKICGVNTDQCVQFTVIGLSDLFPDSVIEVISDACSSDTKRNHQDGLFVMAGYKNVVINKLNE